MNPVQRPETSRDALDTANLVDKLYLTSSAIGRSGMPVLAQDRTMSTVVNYLLFFFMAATAGSSRFVDADWICANRAETTEPNPEEIDPELVLTASTAARCIRHAVNFAPRHTQAYRLHESSTRTFTPTTANS